MYGVYGRILLEHFSDLYDYLEKFKKLNKKTNSYDEFSNIKNQIESNYIEIIVFFHNVCGIVFKRLYCIMYIR